MPRKVSTRSCRNARRAGKTASERKTMTTIEARERHQPCEIRHRDDIDWETIRWPGAHHPIHNHEFAQVWYVLSGTFVIGGKTATAGAMIFHPDPHFEDEFSTETGGEIPIVQYPGPTTGGRPIYDKRFNMEKRKPIAEERTDI